MSIAALTSWTLGTLNGASVSLSSTSPRTWKSSSIMSSRMLLSLTGWAVSMSKSIDTDQSWKTSGSIGIAPVVHLARFSWGLHLRTALHQQFLMETLSAPSLGAIWEIPLLSSRLLNWPHTGLASFNNFKKARWLHTIANHNRLFFHHSYCRYTRLFPLLGYFWCSSVVLKSKSCSWRWMEINATFICVKDVLFYEWWPDFPLPLLLGLDICHFCLAMQFLMVKALSLFQLEKRPLVTRESSCPIIWANSSTFCMTMGPLSGAFLDGALETHLIKAIST